MIKGSHQTEESKRKNSESHKNRTPWNKGRKGIYSEDTLNKMSKAKIGHTPWNKDTHIQLNTGKTHFKKGQIPYNKGKLRPEFLGENNPNWNGGNQLRISRRNNKKFSRAKIWNKWN